MRAVLDLGTNSVRLLVAERTPGGPKPLVRESRVTRLGAGVDQSQMLDEAAMARALEALADLTRQIPPGVPKLAVATSALRDARNGPVFARLIQETLGLPVRILSGTEEGELSFAGAVYSLQSWDLQGPITVADIGGGSTEIYTGTPEGEFWGGGSAQVGAVRLLERFGNSARTMGEEIEKVLAPLAQKSLPYNPRHLVAVGGTATSLAAILLHLAEYSDDAVTGCSFSLEEVRESAANLGRLSLQERREIPSLQAGREDLIMYGAALLVKVVELLGFSRFFVSAGDLLYGALVQPSAVFIDAGV